MDFYERKKRATTIIDNMYLDGKGLDEIDYKVSTLFGLGRSFTKKRITLLDKLATKGKGDVDGRS